MGLSGHPLAQLALLQGGRRLEAPLHGPGGGLRRHVARLRGMEEVGAHEAAAVEQLLARCATAPIEETYGKMMKNDEE